MQVTSLEQLKQMILTNIVKLPNFEDGTELVVELKKPNMMQLVASGKIPNSLLTVAMDIFNGKGGELASNAMADAKALKDMVAMMECLAEACLIAPTYKDLKKHNIDLTQDQLLCIYTYSQGGLNALKSFRGE